MKTFITLHFVLFCSFLTFGQLTEINNEIHKYSSSGDIRHSFIYKNQYAFVDGYYQASLWLSDGTKEGTRIISTSANNQGEPVVIQDKIIVVDYDWDNSKYDLYSVTENSKELLKSDIPRVNRLTATSSIAFFYDDYKIWRTDGTAVGTYSIAEFSSSSSTPVFYAIDDYLYFENTGFVFRNDGINGNEQIKAVNDDFGGFNPNGVFLNGIYYFNGFSEQDGSELWRTDFTDVGTYMVKDLNPGTYTYDTTKANSSSPKDFEVIGNQVYFITQLSQIWLTDGTETGTRLVKNFYPNSFTNEAISTRTLNGKYVFSLVTYEDGHELWSSDGTEAGTQIITNIFEGTGNALISYTKQDFVEHQGYIYFGATSSEHGYEIWRTNGTASGTEIVYDLVQGMRSSYVSSFEVLGDDLFFTASIPSADTSILTLFKLDLTKLDNVIIPKYDYDIEWYRQIGIPPGTPTFSHTYSGEIALDSKDATYITGMRSYPYKKLFVHQTSTEIPFDTIIASSFQPHIAKFDKDGSLEWAQYIGGQAYGFQEPAVITDKDDNVIVGTSFWKEGRFGDVVISPFALYNSTSAIAKFDKAGDLQWISKGHGFRFELYDITTDADDNIYFIAAFDNGLMYWDGQTINNNKEEGSAVLVKLSKDGNLKWIKELEGDVAWSRGDIQVNGEDIIVALSEGDRNIWSSCEYRDWNFLLTKYSLDGTMLWSNLMEASDLSTIASMDVNSEGDIIIAGRFRGTFDFGNKTIESPRGNDCHLSVGFTARFNDNGRFRKEFQEEQNTIDPYQVIFKEKDYYLISIEYFEESTSYDGYYEYRIPNSNKQIVIRKFDYLNNLQNVKSFRKFGNQSYDDAFSNEPRIAFTSDGYTMLSDNASGHLDTLPHYVSNVYGNLDMMLMKFEWDETEPLKIFEDEASLQLKLAPNPASDFTHLKILDDAFKQFDLTIYNIAGQQIHFEQKQNDFDYYKINVQYLTPGTYILHFRSPTGQQVSLKMVKI